ncbi:MAG: LamG domain-containing protein [Clostridia bacterium]|nr:LamG domain-containing protein [Clostridia bacterium]
MKKKLMVITVLALAVCVLLGTLPSIAEDAKTYYWPLDENFADTSSGADFTNAPANFVDGAFEGSKAWDSTGGGCGETAAITVDASSFTVSAWVNIPSTNNTTWNAIFSTGTLQDSNFIELYYSNEGGNVTLRGSVGNVLDMYIATGVALDTWHNVALTFDGATKAFKGYLDGNLTVTLDASSTNYAGLNNAVVYLGHEKTNYVFGQTYIDDVKLITRAYSAEEIAALYTGNSSQTPVEKTYDPIIWIVDEENDAVFGAGGGDVFSGGISFTDYGVPYEAQDGIDAAKFVLDSKALADPYVALKVKDISAYHYAVLVVKYVTNDNSKTPRASLRVNAGSNWIMNDNVNYVPGEWAHILIPLTGDGLSFWPPEVTETYKEGDPINEVRVLFLVNGGEGNFEGDAVYFKALGFFHTLEEAQAYRAFELEPETVPTTEPTTAPTTEPVTPPPTGDTLVIVPFAALVLIVCAAVVLKKKRTY